MKGRPASAIGASLGVVLCLCASVWGGRIEVGQLDLPGVSSPSSFERIAFQGSFDRTPLVFVVTPDTGDGPGIVRVNNVGTTGFDLGYFEAPAEDADHGPVTGVTFLAIEPGRHELAPGVVIEAGSIETSDFVQGGDNEPSGTVSFKGGFAGTPVVFAATQTFRNEPAAQPGAISSPFLATSVAVVNNSGFNVALERAETLDGSSVTQPETIAFLALPETIGSATEEGGGSVLFDALNSGDVVDDNPTFITFNQAFGSAPLVLAQRNTRDGGDGGWTRYTSVTAGGASVFIEEDIVDGETNHTDEEVALLAFAEAFEAELDFVTTTITWQGADSFSTNAANWDNWDGSDANLIIGDELVFNDIGSATPNVDVELDYAAPLGGITFEQNTAYTLGGAGSFRLDDAAAITNDTALTQRIDVDLTATGSELILDAQNTAGTLDLNGNLDLADSAGVVLRILGDGDVSLDGDVTGDGGAIWKQGAGSLTLSGTNTFTGSLQIDAGNVTLANGDAIADDANVVMTAAGAGLVLATGETFATLAGLGTVDLATHRLTLDADADTNFSGTIAGASPTAGVTKRGSGTFTLAGTQTFPGELRVEAGAVLAQGSLAGGVLNQARFRGSGTIAGDLTATTGSITEIDSGVATLAVSGDAQFDANSTLRVDIDSGGSSDTLEVDGGLSFAAGSRVAPSVSGEWRNIADGQRFVVAEADAGVTDAGVVLLGVHTLLDFALDPAFVNGDTQLALIASSTLFEPRAVGGNRTQIARGLDTLVQPSLSSDAEAQLLTLKTLDLAALNAAFDQLSPAAYAAAPAAVRAHHTGFAGRVGRHLSRQRLGLSRAAASRRADAGRSSSPQAFGYATLAAAADEPRALAEAIHRTSNRKRRSDADANANANASSDPANAASKLFHPHDSQPDMGGFVEGFALFSDHGDETAVQAQLRGGQVGFDHRVTERWTLGGSFAIGEGDVDSHPDGGSGDWLSFAGGPYAAYDGGAWFFDGGFTLGYDRFDQRREIDALGVEAASDFHTWNVGANGRVGTRIDLGPWTLVPRVGLAFQHTHLGDVSERDAGPLGLRIPEQGSNTLRTRVSVAASAVFDVGGMAVAPELLVGYERDWLSGERTEASFLAGGERFDIASGDLDARDSLLLGGGASVLLNARSSLHVRYDGRFDADGETHGVTAGWAWRF